MMIIVTLLVTVTTSVLVSLLMPRSYLATSTVVLNYKGMDPVTGHAVPALLASGFMATQVDIIKSENVALRVVDALRLSEDEVIIEDYRSDTGGKGDIRNWLANILTKYLYVKPSRESSVLDITFQGTSPQFAAEVANAFATEYQKASVQLKADPLQQVSGYFDFQIKTLRQNLELAQHKLSRYQEEKGVVNADSRIDVETARLNDLSNQLVTVQSQLMEANAKKLQMASSAKSTSPDVVSNALIQNMKISLAQAEVKLTQVSERYSEHHPLYQVAKAEVDKLRNELRRNIETVSGSVENNARIFQRKEVELQSAVDEQRRKVMELNHARGELTILAKDVDNAQRAYDKAMERLSETSLEAKSNQPDAAVLSLAVPPIRHASPNLIRNATLAIFLGILFGIGFSLVAEMLDRRVRSIDDVLIVLQAPVVRVIEWGPAWNASRSRTQSLIGSGTNIRRPALTY